MRFVKFVDFSETVYDSCLPDYEEMVSLETEKSQYVYNGDAVVRLRSDELSQVFETVSLTNSKIKQFPFEGDPSRNVTRKAGILQVDTDVASDPINVAGQTLNQLNIVYLTRYMINLVGQSFNLPNYNNLIAPKDSSVSYNLKSGLASSYFLTASSVSSDTLYDLSENGCDLDLSPSLNASLHPRPDESVNVPVPNLTNDGSLEFNVPATATDTLVELAAATTNYNDHKMTSGMSLTDTSFSISVTFRLDASGAGRSRFIVERAARNDSGSPPPNINFAREYTIRINSSNQMEFRLHQFASSKGLISSSTFNAGVWYNVVVVYDGNEYEANGDQCCEMYVNGVLETSATAISTAAALPAPMNNAGPTPPLTQSRLWIGAGGKNSSYQPDDTLQFIGEIHSVHIWKSRQINSTEAAAISTIELEGTAAGIILHRNSSDDYGSEGLQDRPLKNGTFRYGISNIEIENSYACWRCDHYGYIRDMLESRKLTATSSGLKPIKVRFVSGSSIIYDPTDTHAQNLSTFATSSMPFFDDGIARNRSDNPDETLLSV